MGRKPTKHLNLPPRVRARKKAGGVLWYYYETGENRREIALGNDYVLAVQKWAELEQTKSAMPARVTTFPALWDKYHRQELPKLAKATQSTHLSDIKHLLKFFGEPPAPLEQIRPLHIRQFLDWLKDKPATANRCKRLFSNLWNHARGWGWTDLENPCLGIRGHATGKREVYISDDIYRVVWEHAKQPIRDAMDLAYLTGQRPADLLTLSERDIQDGSLPIRQAKTGARVRINVTGELAELIQRIQKRKKGYKIWVTALLVQMNGKPLTRMTLRNGFTLAREAATQANPDKADEIRAFWFYDLRAKAADDKAETAGESEAQKLLGHTDGRTTAKHYLRRGKRVDPTK